MKKQKKEIKSQNSIYIQCLRLIEDLKRKITHCSNNYKSSYGRNLKHFKNNNKYLLSYRDNTMNKIFEYKHLLNINYRNKVKYEYNLNLMYNNNTTKF